MSKLSRRTLLALLPLSILMAGTVSAAEIRPYDAQNFERLAQANRPILLAVHATWCPTCKAQGVVLDRLVKQPAWRDLTVMVIDFDTAKPLLRTLKVDDRATLIAYHGRREVGRSHLETEPAAIEALLKKTRS